MAEPAKKKETDMLSDDELMRLLLCEDEEFKDEGRDLYMDEVLKKMRKDLGTEEDKDPDTQ
ncbi:MAG: hypothetical protein II805_01610 [Candidatus Methanomethylophilus sp.]|jgi:hypothetical protein|nr:hypothetical protein [Methanomethylophilus sp.]MBQ4411595.1 hypothetical protein [Methanomethylophilus sp.]MBQ5447356.1 hypothetical protein [Methanomethylophilus sp.]MBQ5483086.1 hypothetical protein [Methanomethylophilus sp.]